MCRGKEININKFKHLNTKIGTVDAKKPKSIYMTISGWVEPSIKNEDIDYKKVIKQIHKQIKTQLFKTINNKNIFDFKKTIIDFDMRESGILYGKKSYMNCDINLYQINDHSLKSKKIQSELDEILDELATPIFSNNKYFKFNKNK